MAASTSPTRSCHFHGGRGGPPTLGLPSGAKHSIYVLEPAMEASSGSTSVQCKVISWMLRQAAGKLDLSFRRTVYTLLLAQDLAATQESLHTTQNSLSDCFNEAGTFHVLCETCGEAHLCTLKPPVVSTFLGSRRPETEELFSAKVRGMCWRMSRQREPILVNVRRSTRNPRAAHRFGA